MLWISGQTIVQSSVVWSHTKQSYEERKEETTITTATATSDTTVVVTKVEETVVLTASLAKATVRITKLEQELETRVAQLEKELREKTTLVVRVTELTQQLRYKETVEVSLRSELLEQRRSCAEKCTACDADVQACGEKVKMWKARVVELGGSFDAEEEAPVTI